MSEDQNLNSIIAEERAVAGIDQNGKLNPERAKDLARLNPQGYQLLVKQGLITNPNEVNNFLHPQGGGGPIPSNSPKSTLRPGQVNSCGNITSSGNYSLTKDIAATGGCINIHDTHDVNLDCQNHAVTYSYNLQDYPVSAAIQVTNVQNFSIKNCNISTTGAYGKSVDIQKSSTANIQNNTISIGFINVADSDYLEITNNTANTHYLQYQSSFNNIHDNRFINDSRLETAISGGLFTGGGHNNIILNNKIDGGWDGIDHDAYKIADYVGADDGIVIKDESQDTITLNTINNNLDCGIETLGFIQLTQITNNRITNSGLCGIGGWYWNSWLNNTVDSNIVDGAAYMFYMFQSYGFAPEEQTIYFKNNTFSNNIFSNQRRTSYIGNTSSYSSLVDYQHPSYGPHSIVILQLGDNLFKNNDFIEAISSPILIPTNMIIDGGGNKCLFIDSPLHPLICNSAPKPSSPTTNPSPTLTPIPISTTTPSASVACQINADKTSGTAPLTVSFYYGASFSGRDDNDYVTNVQWDFDGDGNWDSPFDSDSQHVIHTYNQAGEYDVKMHLQIHNGLTSDLCSKKIIVEGGTTIGNATISTTSSISDSNGVWNPVAINLSLSGFSTPGRSIAALFVRNQVGECSVDNCGYSYIGWDKIRSYGTNGTDTTSWNPTGNLSPGVHMFGVFALNPDGTAGQLLAVSKTNFTTAGSNQCYAGKTCTCGATPTDTRDPGHCDECNGAWCNGGRCNSCQP